MEDPKHINLVGYSEMYEWYEVPLKNPFGRFVQFSKRDPAKVEYFDGTGHFLGVSTIQSTITSDDPPEWRYAYMCSEVGDRFLEEQNIAVGIKQYDQLKELSYITTRPYKYFKTISSKNYKQNIPYIKRSSRKEWVRINLIGKVIVEDDGSAVPGEYCMPATGKKFNIEKGIATKWDNKSQLKFYVIKRITDHTIEILNYPTFTNISEKKKNEKQKG